METAPFFSVVVVNYNYGRFLPQCVESVLSQSYPQAERELIVIDDGSTDDSLKRLEPYKGRIHLIAQENRGQGGAFAAGFKAARGRFVCLLDADDYWHPEKLSACAELLKSSGAPMLQHFLRDVDAGGAPLPNPLPAWPALYNLEDYRDGRCEDAATSGLIVRKDLLETLLPVPPEIFCFYDEYLIAHGLFSGPIANLPRVLGYHRVHGANNWALRHEDPDRLDWYLRQYRALMASFEKKLSGRGLTLTPRHRLVFALEEARCRILAAAHRGQRLAALKLWLELAAGPGRTRLGAFRTATLLSALVSPRLYLELYRFYGARRRLSLSISGSMSK